VRLAEKIPSSNPQWDGEISGPGASSAPYRIYNIGNNHPVDLDVFISILEEKLSKKAKRVLLPMQPGDVPATLADIADLESDVGFKPATPLRQGIGRFVDWYLEYYGSDKSVGGQTSRGSRSENGSGPVGDEARTPSETQETTPEICLPA